MDNNIIKFADDTKLYGIVTNSHEATSLQKDLNVLLQWTRCTRGSVVLHWSHSFS